MGKTFKHSGDLGDIIFSLPAIRALGGGILYLDPEGGKSDPYIRKSILKGQTRLNLEAINSLRPLLIKQPYIEDVRVWQGEPVEHNLDQHREVPGKNLCDVHLKLFNLPTEQCGTAWLTNIEPEVDPAHPIVLARSLRYVSNYDFWLGALPQIHQQSVFVGTPLEHQVFEHVFGYSVLYKPTPTILDLARVIAGCAQFVGNASLPHAIAEGLKKPLVCEVYRIAHRINFKRPDAHYV